MLALQEYFRMLVHMNLQTSEATPLINSADFGINVIPYDRAPVARRERSHPIARGNSNTTSDNEPAAVSIARVPSQRSRLSIPSSVTRTVRFVSVGCRQSVHRSASADYPQPLLGVSQ